MFRTFTCITAQHSPWLLALAVLVCLVSALTTMRLYGHGRAQGARRGLPWLIAGGVTGGAGIWATHFISMLAYEPGLPTGYEPVGTVVSLVIAMGGVAAGLIVAARAPLRAGPAVGGALVGLAIASMHFAGMSAFRTAGEVHWDLAYVAFALIVGVAVAALALSAAREGLGRTLLAAVLLCVAIVILHFVSMAAVIIVPDAAVAPPPSSLPHGALAIGVGVLSGLIMVGAAATLTFGAWNQRRTLDQLNLVIEAMPDALAYHDAQDRFLLWNRRYEETLAKLGVAPVRGETYLDCVLRPAAALGFAPEGEEAEWIAARLARRQEAYASREERAPDGRWVRTQERRTENGGRVTVVSDISDLMRAADELSTARDAAESANRAKSEFLANMSHEIRTPLNGVLGVADALALTALTEEQAGLVEIIRGSGATLDRLLGDILDLARVETGALELVREPFHLADAMREIARLSQARAVAKAIGFELVIAAEAERWFTGDAVRLKQIVGNLAANAVKFTQTGSVTLAVQPAEGGRFQISVTDTGPGFDDETRARLFARFQQGDGSTNRRFGGSGLGLAICRELADLMGADLTAAGSPGEGAVFTLSLSLPDCAAPVAPVAPGGATEVVPADDGEGSPLRLLVVDDNVNNRRLLQVLLSHLGAETVEAEDGGAALAEWRAGRFDAVLMDMQMPGVDGLTATRMIRTIEAEQGLAPTPVLVVSANAMPEHVAAAYAAGADLHLAKPLSAERLFAALASLPAAVVEEAA